MWGLGLSLRGGIFVDVRVGDILEMKKQHPCGAKQFYVLRSGMDFRLRCCGCEREFLIPRVKAEKNIKKISKKETFFDFPIDK